MIHEWEFDNYSHQHWNEIRAGKVDKTRSWVELKDTEDGQKITIYQNKEPTLEIDAYRDQWGTYITFRNPEGYEAQGITIAQEDQTKSFIDSLIAALTKFKNICDFETQPPVYTERENESTLDS